MLDLQGQVEGLNAWEFGAAKENNQMDLYGAGDDESDKWSNVIFEVGTELGETTSTTPTVAGTSSILSPTLINSPAIVGTNRYFITPGTCTTTTT